MSYDHAFVATVAASLPTAYSVALPGEACVTVRSDTETTAGRPAGAGARTAVQRSTKTTK